MPRFELVKLSLESGAVILFGFVWWKSKRELNLTKAIADYAANSPVFTPGSLADLMSEDRLTKVSKLLDYEESELMIRFKAFLTGVVDAKKSIQGYIKKDQRMVLSKLLFEPIYSGSSSILDSREIVTKIRRLQSFNLVDQLTKRVATVSNTKGVQFGQALHFMSSDVQYIRPSFPAQLLGWIVHLVESIMVLFRLRISLRGIQLGHKTVELGIKLGQTLTCFGEFTYDKRLQTLNVDKPWVFSQNKRGILNSVIGNSRKTSLVKNIAVIFFWLFAFLLVRRLIRVSGKLRRKFRQLRRDMRFDSLGGLTNLLTTNIICQDCRDRPKNIIFKPCWHFVVCKECFQKRPVLTCPICSKQVQDTVTIFVV